MDLTALKGCQLTEERMGHPLALGGADIIGLYFFLSMQLAHSDGKQEVAELLCEFPRLLVNSGGLGEKKAKDNDCLNK